MNYSELVAWSPRDNECRGRIARKSIGCTGTDTWRGRIWRTGCQSVGRLEVQGCRGRGRPKKTWEQSMKCDIKKYGMQRVEPFDKNKWGN